MLTEGIMRSTPSHHERWKFHCP